MILFIALFVNPVPMTLLSGHWSTCFVRVGQIRVLMSGALWYGVKEFIVPVVELMIVFSYNELYMLSPQFYSQVVTCPLCKGFGTEKVPPHEKNSFPCKECGGLGVFLVQSEETFVWGMPAFIDFGTRKKIKILKIFFLVIAILLFILVYYFVSQIQVPRLNIPSIK